MGKSPKASDPDDVVTSAPVRRHDGGSRCSVLVIADGGVVSHPLPPAGELVIGRGSTAALRIEDRSLSREHAMLSIDGADVTLIDLGSSNGTRVGGELLTPRQRRRLAVGDVATLGDVTLVLQRRPSGAPASTGTPPAPDDDTTATDLVINDEAMRQIYRVIERVAAGDLPVLLLGETGVGKEVVAERLHQASRRRAGPFVRLNCAAIQETLLESELFGHTRGAFTGATAAKAGLLETAAGGTLLLDEVGELPLPLQAKLLRVLEERKVLRVGALEPIDVDLRFVASTNRDLEAAMQAGTFREDLYYRLAGVSIVIPPLRERPAEIGALADMFLRRINERDGVACSLDAAARAWLSRQEWPGNVRELRNVIERAALLAEHGRIGVAHLPAEPEPGEADTAPAADSGPAAAAAPPVEAAGVAALRRGGEAEERRLISETLERLGGNQTRAAKALGISRRTLINRIEAYGLNRPRKA